MPRRPAGTRCRTAPAPGRRSRTATASLARAANRRRSSATSLARGGRHPARLVWPGRAALSGPHWRGRRADKRCRTGPATGSSSKPTSLRFPLRQQLVDRVLAVELVVVELNPAGDDPAGRQRPVDRRPGLLGLERADQPAHRCAERDHVPRRSRELRLECRQRSELVSHGGVQGPPRPVRVIRGPDKRVALVGGDTAAWSDRVRPRLPEARSRGCTAAPSRSTATGRRRSTACRPTSSP